MKNIALIAALIAASIAGPSFGQVAATNMGVTAVPTVLNGKPSYTYVWSNGGALSQLLFGTQVVDATHGLPVTVLSGGSVPTAVTTPAALPVQFLLLATGTGKLFYDGEATVGAASSFLVLLDSATVVSGAVTPKAAGGVLMDCVGPVANGTLALNYASSPIGGATAGYLLEVSTGSTCASLTPANALWIKGRAQ